MTQAGQLEAALGGFLKKLGWRDLISAGCRAGRRKPGTSGGPFTTSNAIQMPETEASSWEELRDGRRFLSTSSETLVSAIPEASPAPGFFAYVI